MKGSIPETDDPRRLIRELDSALVAFSGGVDSTVVLRLALDELGPTSVLAVTAHGDVHSGEELTRAQSIAATLGSRHEVFETRELQMTGFTANTPDRCYWCRSALYPRLCEIAEREGMRTVIDGCNADDLLDYRPGTKAASLAGVRSPLAEAGFDKSAVRALARSLGLPNAELPASPCLASRIPYGDEITLEKLRMIEAAECRLRDLGFSLSRVRHHGCLARIEVAAIEIPLAAETVVRRTIVNSFRSLGYAYVTLDLEGFRSGSLNEVLDMSIREDA